MRERSENRTSGNDVSIFRGSVLNVRGIIITGNEKDADFQCRIVCETRELAIYHRGVPAVVREREDERADRGLPRAGINAICSKGG